MTVAWVVGSNGLLGSALCRVLRSRGTKLYLPPERLCWRDEGRLERQFAACVREFSAQAVAAGRWEIYWAAGVCTMGSTESDVTRETRILSLLLNTAGADRDLAATPGAIAFASSAGGIYAGSTDRIVTEHTPPAPTTAYAREKLLQEGLVYSFARANHVAALLARLSTLYGPGQSFGKQQGLIAHIARCVLRNRPVQIYVPYDTIRDYILADDAAAAMAHKLADIAPSDTAIRIVASEQPTTIAEIISLFRRIARRAPRVVTSTTRMTHTYPRRAIFRSLHRDTHRGRTSLLLGIAQVMATERAALGSVSRAAQR